MTRDTEDVVARLVAHGRKHGALLNADNEAWDAIDAMLADRQSLSDRIDGLEGLLRDATGFIEHMSEYTDYPSDELAREEYDDNLAKYRAALHQEGIATDVGR